MGDAGQKMIELQGENRIKHIAVTNFDTRHLRDLLEMKPVGLPVRANQVQYSMLDRRPENGMLALAKEFNFRLFCFGAVAGGWLSDRWLGASEAERKKKKGGSSTVSMR